MVSALVVTVLLPLAAWVRGTNAQACQSFVPSDEGRGWSMRRTPPVRSSGGVICDTDDGTPCEVRDSWNEATERNSTETNATTIWVPTREVTFFGSELNITTPSREAARGIYELIGSTLGVNFFEYYLAYIPPSRSLTSNAPVPHGAVGYFARGSTLVCYNGTLEGCPSDFWVASGTAVEACTPFPYNTVQEAFDEEPLMSHFVYSLFINSTLEEAQRPFNRSGLPWNIVPRPNVFWYRYESGAAGRREVTGMLMSVALVVGVMWSL